jgi:two-component system, OmpR family, response regulator
VDTRLLEASPPEAQPPLTVLVIDDDAGIRSLLRLALPHFGLAAHFAIGGEEAVEIYRVHGDAIDIVLTDVQMPPGMDGPQTIAALRTLNPGVQFCFMTGGTGNYSTADLRALGPAHIFSKPFPEMREFARKLRELAGGR